MKTARRFVNEESGVTLVLSIIMIVLIGVMGAGLLTFVNTNMNTVIEENRGQRAFEVADAGIAAAERQLETDCIGNSTCMIFYNDPIGDAGGDDKRWSVAKGGLTLNDLDGDATTSDSVTVTIDYRESDATTNDYKVISTGTYGSSKRKIEAIFKPIAGGGGSGGNVINPAYYTQSDIRIWSDPTGGVSVKGMSLFSERNIIIEGLLPYTSCVEPDRASFTSDSDYKKALADFDKDAAYNLCLKREWEVGNDAGKLTTTPGNKVLKDWNSTTYTPPGNWNTIGRLDRLNSSFEGVGFGADGMICASTTNCDDPSDSVADGRYGY